MNKELKKRIEIKLDRYIKENGIDERGRHMKVHKRTDGK